VRELTREADEASRTADDLQKKLDTAEDKLAEFEEEEDEVNKETMAIARRRVASLDVSWRENNGESASLVKQACYTTVPAIALFAALRLKGLSRGGGMLGGLVHKFLGSIAGISFAAITVSVVIMLVKAFVDWLRGRAIPLVRQPIKYRYTFLKWCNPSPTHAVDKRPEAVKLTDLVHKEPMYAKVVLTRTHVPGFTKETKMKISVESLSQVCHHSNLSPTLDDKTSSVKLDNAIGKLMSVNVDRYGNISSQNVTTNSLMVAYGLRKAQTYRLEKAKIPFPRAGDVVG